VGCQSSIWFGLNWFRVTPPPWLSICSFIIDKLDSNHQKEREQFGLGDQGDQA